MGWFPPNWRVRQFHRHVWFPVLEFGDTFVSLGLVPLKIPEEVVKLQKYPDAELQLVTVQLREEEDEENALDGLYQSQTDSGSLVLTLISVVEMGYIDHLHSLVSWPWNNALKVKLRCYGTWRELVVTTKLPVLKDPWEGEPFYIELFTDPALFTAAFIQKAVGILSGDDYQYKNWDMAHETFLLTGWLPEVGSVNSLSGYDVAELFRLKMEGKNTLGLGTHGMLTQKAELLGVRQCHHYTVTKFDEATKMITLTDPWEDPESDERLIKFHVKYI